MDVTTVVMEKKPKIIADDPVTMAAEIFFDLISRHTAKLDKLVIIINMIANAIFLPHFPFYLL